MADSTPAGYDPLSLPNATTNSVPSDAGYMQRLSSGIGGCDITISDDSTTTPDVTFQFKDLRGRNYKGYVTVLVIGRTASWGAVAGANIYTAAATTGLLLHAITAQRIGFYRTDENGTLKLEINGGAGTYYVGVTPFGGRSFQSTAITEI